MQRLREHERRRAIRHQSPKKRERPSDHSSKKSYTIESLAAIIKGVESASGVINANRPESAHRIAWEAARFPVYTDLTRKLSIHGQAMSHSRSSARRCRIRGRIVGFLNLLREALRSSVAAPRFSDVLFWANAGHYLGSSGRYDNPLVDPIVQNMSGLNTAVIERPYGSGHPAPRALPGVRHSDFTDRIAIVLSKYIYRGRRPSVSGLAGRLCELFPDRLLSREALEQDMQKAFRAVRSVRMVLRLLLKWLKPGVVVLICSYGREGLILAARDLGIPTVELQHGTITPYHLGYAVPKGSHKLTSPDYIFLFGQFWKDSVNYGIPDDRLIPVGYPHFSIEKERFHGVQKRRQLLFLSQGTTGDRISRFAVKLCEAKPNEAEYVYKLHPGEWEGWRNRYPWLRDAADRGIITVVDQSQPELYELLAESSWQVGVNSTALFEGLGMGCRTYLVDLPGVEYMTKVIERGNAEIVRDPDEIDLTESRPASITATSYFFASDWESRILKAIEDVQRRGCPQ